MNLPKIKFSPMTLEENIETIKETLVLVFIEQDIGTNELVKTLQKLGTVSNFEKLKQIQISKKNLFTLKRK